MSGPSVAAVAAAPPSPPQAGSPPQPAPPQPEYPLWAKIVVLAIVALVVALMAYLGHEIANSAPTAEPPGVGRPLPAAESANADCTSPAVGLQRTCLLYVAEMHLMRAHFEAVHDSFQLSSWSRRATIGGLIMVVVVGSVLVLFHFVARALGSAEELQLEGGGIKAAVKTVYPGLLLAVLGAIGLFVIRFEPAPEPAEYRPAYLASAAAPSAASNGSAANPTVDNLCAAAAAAGQELSVCSGQD